MSGSQFTYKAQLSNGKVIVGQLEALDTTDVVRQLANRGAILISASGARPPLFPSFSHTMRAERLTGFLGDLAVMLRSGMTLDEALLMACVGLPASAAAIVKALHRDLVSGMTFSSSLERYPNIFSVDLVAMTRVGEATGDLHVVFASIAAERERAQKLADKVRAAVRYPAFLIVSAVAVFVFFLLHVIPQFAPLFEDPSVHPGTLVLMLLKVSGWLVANATELGVTMLLIFAAGAAAWRQQASRAVISRAALQLPLVNGIWITWRTSRFLASLSLMLAQEVGADETLRILRDSIGEGAGGALDTAYDEVRRGARLSEALNQTGLFDTFVSRMLRIGEETSQLPKLAGEAAAIYSRKLEKRLDAATSIVGPAAIILISLLIGGLMSIIMSALLSVNEAVL